MKVKRILFVAPHSFPIHSSESIVNAKLAYTLSKGGFELDIFSAKEDGLNYPSSNNSIFDDLIEKVKTLPLVYFSRKRSLKENLITLYQHIVLLLKTGIYYNGISWSYKVIQQVEENISKFGKYDIIITRGYRSEVVGLYFKKKYGITWIANWNDPYPELRFPFPYGKGIDAKLPYMQERILSKLQKNVNIHTFPCERLRDYMLQYMNNVHVENTAIMPHMAHTEFFPKANKNSNKKLRIIHAGNVSHPRNPNNFLNALNHLQSNNPKIIDKVEIIFIGKQDNNFIERVNNLNLENVIKVLPPMEYFNLLQTLSESDVSLIIEAICEEGIYLPTKVVDSLQCKTPIFCVSPPDGTLNDIINKHNIGYFASNDNVKQISDTIEKIISDKLENKLPKIDVIDVSEYFEKEIFQKYVEVFQKL